MGSVYEARWTSARKLWADIKLLTDDERLEVRFRGQPGRVIIEQDRILWQFIDIDGTDEIGFFDTPVHDVVFDRDSTRHREALRLLQIDSEYADDYRREIPARISVAQRIQLQDALALVGIEHEPAATEG